MKISHQLTWQGLAPCKGACAFSPDSWESWDLNGKHLCLPNDQGLLTHLLHWMGLDFWAVTGDEVTALSVFRLWTLTHTSLLPLGSLLFSLKSTNDLRTIMQYIHPSLCKHNWIKHFLHISKNSHRQLSIPFMINVKTVVFLLLELYAPAYHIP